jgi:SAM-dependent methyltransferase
MRAEALSMKSKQAIVSIARRAGLLPLLELGRFARSVLQDRKSNQLVAAANPGRPQPPLWMMHDMYAHTSYERYERSGRRHADEIRRRIEPYLPLDRVPAVAEWGCGLGRIIRRLPADWQLQGFDLNAAAVKWCRANLGAQNFHPNGLMPPLPAGTAAFDAVYAISVFTHLSADAHARWIAEIARVLKPGGVFLATFHGEEQCSGLLSAERVRFDTGELVVRGNVREGSRTFVAYHPDRFVRELLASAGLVVGEGPVPALGQTLYLATRTSP